MPDVLIHRLRAAHDRSSLDDFWCAWSTAAEEGLFRAHRRAGGPVAGNPQMYLDRGRLRVRCRRLCGRSAGGSCSSRFFRVSRGDEVDSHSAQYFANSSLAPVLLFRRRIKSVADVLRNIRQRGFSESTTDALHRHWAAVCRQGPSGPVVTLEPWSCWIPPDLRGFSTGLCRLSRSSTSLLVRLSFFYLTLGCLGGGMGEGRIWGLGVMPDSGLTLFLLSLFWLFEIHISNSC